MKAIRLYPFVSFLHIRFLPCDDIAEKVNIESQALTLDFQVLELWNINFFGYKSPSLCGILL